MCGARATRCRGGSAKIIGLLRHLEITTSRLSVEEKTSLDTCSGFTSADKSFSGIRRSVQRPAVNRTTARRRLGLCQYQSGEYSGR